MTYCVGLALKDGLVMLSDTRTNAGFDNISTFQKMHVWEAPGQHIFMVMSAGNLAVTQAVLCYLQEGLDMGGEEPQRLSDVTSMSEAARLTGAAVRAVYAQDGPALEAQDSQFNISLLLGGQVKGGRMRLYQIYAAGNFIEATEDTPYFQIGEHKYGKPILDRAVSYDTPVEEGLKLSLISMDSTMRSNLSVGMPLDLVVYRRDSFEISLRRRIEADDPYFAELSGAWSDALLQAHRALPAPEWDV